MCPGWVHVKFAQRLHAHTQLSSSLSFISIPFFHQQTSKYLHKINYLVKDFPLYVTWGPFECVISLMRQNSRAVEKLGMQIWATFVNCNISCYHLLLSTEPSVVEPIKNTIHANFFGVHKKWQKNKNFHPSMRDKVVKQSVHECLGKTPRYRELIFFFSLPTLEIEKCKVWKS